MKNRTNDIPLSEALIKIQDPELILSGSFGIERESLRVTPTANLALTPHPAAFGNKLTNPEITTDFSESQVEIITPVCKSISEAYRTLASLCRQVEREIAPEELLWPQSMPCILPEDKRIPIARYEGETEEAKAAMAYRKGLVKTYGAKKQMMSGIHFNFSFSEPMLKTLCRASGLNAQQPDVYRYFKDQLYLKLVRGYLRYRWLIIALTGCSTGVHESFLPECLSTLPCSDNHGARYNPDTVSLRNSRFGYKNAIALYPDYTDIETFVRDIRSYVKKGTLSAPKELYTQIRMKPKHPTSLLDSLTKDGIRYIEIRTLDLNVFDPCGIAETDMHFMQHFLIWLLTVPENDYADWQAEALQNEEKTAFGGLSPECTLSRDGQPIRLKDWADAVLSDMETMENALGTGGESSIAVMRERIQNPGKTYAGRLTQGIAEKGFLPFLMDCATQNTAALEKI